MHNRYIPESSTHVAKSERIPEIDLLRFIAALTVAIYHWTYRPLTQAGAASDTAFGAFQHVSKFGYLGVDLFFLISGFVIFWSASKAGPTSFLASRFARLFPTFWLCVAVTVAMLAAAGQIPADMTARSVLLNLTMIPLQLGQPAVDGVYWTLFVELKFYLLILLALLFVPKRHFETAVYIWLAGAVIGFAAVRFGVSGRGLGVLKSATLYPFGPLFIAGALYYLVRQFGLTPTRAAGLLVCLLLALLNSAAQAPEFFFDVSVLSRWCVAGITVAEFAVFAMVALGRWRLPPLPVWAQLGAMTYPLYLLHNRIGKLIWFELPESLGNFPRLVVVAAVVFALTLAVTMLTEKRIAPRLNRLLQRWLDVPRGVPVRART